MPELCRRCKKTTLRLVGFDETRVYKKCTDCHNSVQEPRVNRR